MPVAYRDFHAGLLAGHAIAIACPRLDDPRGYVEKLEAVIRANDLVDITVAHMEVPCCTGLLTIVLEARRRAGITAPIHDVVIGIGGEVVARQGIDRKEAAGAGSTARRTVEGENHERSCLNVLQSV